MRRNNQVTLVIQVIHPKKKKRNCKEVKVILMKVEVGIEGITVYNLHPEFMEAPVFEMRLGKS